MNRRVRHALSGSLAFVLLMGVSACAGLGADRPLGAAALQRLLNRQAEAVLHRDAGAYLRTVDPRSAAYRSEQWQVIRNLVRLPLAEWSYRITGLNAFRLPQRLSDGDSSRIAAKVQLRYRLRGYDRAPVTAEEYLTLTERDGRWYVSSDSDGAPSGRKSAVQLWEQGRVTVVRGAHSLVLGADQDRTALRALARAADRAVPQVRRVWPKKWSGRVVVEAPASLEQMAALLDAPATSYQEVAAVTTGQVTRRAAVDRIIVNPEAFGELGGTARQIVLTHETTHVATRSFTSATTPLWLSEGFADWVGYRGTGRHPRQVAVSLGSAVRDGAVPRELPADEDFRFRGSTDRLGRAYEGGWLACEMIARQWGTVRLVEFYAAVGAGEEREQRPETVAKALRQVLDVTPEDFTARWRAYLTQELG